MCIFWDVLCYAQPKIVNGTIEEREPIKDLHEGKKLPFRSAIKVVYQPDLTFQWYVNSRDLMKQTGLECEELEQYQKKIQ